MAHSVRGDKVNRARGEQQVRAQAMREQGYEWREIGCVLAEDYTIVGLPAMRLAHGWSQADAADAWNERWPDLEYPKTRKWISERERWPVSGREPHIHDLVKFCHLYECRLADLLIGIDEHFSPKSSGSGGRYREPVERREVLTGLIGAAGVVAGRRVLPGATVSVGARVGGSDIDRLSAEIDELMLLDQRQGGGVYRPTLRLRDRVRALLSSASYGPSVGRELRSLLGRLQRDLGWAAFDAGEQDLARRHYAEALSAATLAGDVPLLVFVLEGMSHLAWAHGDGREAVAHAEAAKVEARRFGTDRLASLLARHAAIGHALVGDRSAADAAFVEAERLYRPHDPGRDPSWLNYYSPASLRQGLAVSHLDRGEPHAAETHARAAWAGHDGDRFPRDLAGAGSWLSLSLVAQGSIDEGAAAVCDTVRLLDGIGSRRIANRLTSLAPIFKTNATVERAPEAVEALRQLQLSGI